MEILPGKEQYISLSKTSKRVPVCGEIKVPDFNPAQVFKALFGDCEDTFLFESGKGPQATARLSMLGESNSRILKFQHDNWEISQKGRPKQILENMDDGFKKLNFSSEVQAVDYLPHFWGGWVGFIGYEAGSLFEKLPPRKNNDLDLPDLCFMEVDRLIVYDHINKFLKCIIALETESPDLDYARMIQEIHETWQKIQKVPNSSSISDPDNIKTGNNGLKSNMTREEYMNRVKMAKEYIGQGDIYQANLSQRFKTKFTGDPFELYQNLKTVNPSPFAGFLKFADLTIVSSSPERLIKIEGNRLETRPIAGTRPRGRNPELDRSLSAELLLNEKERAEHLMLVDLERNDLGRICKVGTVKVTDLMFLEQYSHVSHIVSNIEGILREEISVQDILKAVFPGGTITGCPKIRCMEIINELEPTSRGPYSGSFGYIGFCPTLDLNIIIRTILLKNDKAYFHVGAGIVADSSPEKEYQETLDKAAAMIDVLSPCVETD